MRSPVPVGSRRFAESKLVTSVDLLWLLQTFVRFYAALSTSQLDVQGREGSVSVIRQLALCRAILVLFVVEHERFTAWMSSSWWCGQLPLGLPGYLGVACSYIGPHTQIFRVFIALFSCPSTGLGCTSCQGGSFHQSFLLQAYYPTGIVSKGR